MTDALQAAYDRKVALLGGAKEDHGGFVLYWEPYTDIKGTIAHAYTLDLVYESNGATHTRYRFATLAEADAQLENLKEEIAVAWAKRAFGLNKPRRPRR